jgi:hypothetical protein
MSAVCVAMSDPETFAAGHNETSSISLPQHLGFAFFASAFPENVLRWSFKINSAGSAGHATDL